MYNEIASVIIIILIIKYHDIIFDYIMKKIFEFLYGNIFYEQDKNVTINFIEIKFINNIYKFKLKLNKIFYFKYSDIVYVKLNNKLILSINLNERVVTILVIEKTNIKNINKDLILNEIDVCNKLKILNKKNRKYYLFFENNEVYEIKKLIKLENNEILFVDKDGDEVDIYTFGEAVAKKIIKRCKND